MLMLYRRSFTLDAPMKDAVLVVDGMGVRAKFELDGKDLGLHPYPYARLEIPVGPLAAGEHEIVAAVDNILSWPRVKLARPYYDFYFYGGFYRGAHYQQSERFLELCDDPATLTREGTFTAGPDGHYYDDMLFRPAGTVYYIL